MYYKYNTQQSIEVPKPFHRIITPIFMGENDESITAGFSVHMTEWPIDGKVDMHSHEESTEVMFCIAGRGKCICDGIEYDFIPGSMIAATPGIMHQIINTGNEILRAVCIFSPPNTAENLSKRASDALINNNLKGQ